LKKESIKRQKYEQLVKLYHGDLFRYAYWLTHDKQVTEDLVQETFLRAWRALDQLADINAAKAWLITILRRENARRFERKQLTLVDIDDCVVLDEHCDIEAGLENKELTHALSMLSNDYKEPLMLQVIFGFSGDEIAQQLGLNKNTVMTRLFRAKKQLATLMTSGNTPQ